MNLKGDGSVHLVTGKEILDEANPMDEVVKEQSDTLDSADKAWEEE